MIQYLALENVGPAASMELEFGDRLNIITGDNGLGKSFLLDIAWWALTRKWPAEINPGMTGGMKALPAREGAASIAFSFEGKSKQLQYVSTFQRYEQAWTGQQGRPPNPGLVCYAMADGSFAAWDPARNYWRTVGGIDVQDRVPAYVFSPSEIWNGLPGPSGTPLCNGLVNDWAGWQKENGEQFRQLQAALHALSPTALERMEAGELTRISLDDVRDMPTIRMPYGLDVPVLHASAGIRRILALAYLLVWMWNEHKAAAKLLGEATTHQMIFLIDEVEAHLHPSWQRQVIPSLIRVVQTLISTASVQIIAATHSPLVMASLEPHFDAEQDAWFDLDLEGNQQVVLNPRDFAKYGTADRWLMSEAFDLSSTRSPEYADLVHRAAALLDAETVNPDEVRAMHEELVAALAPTDDFLFRWQYICRKKGWLA